jgi:hypothetical protein
MAPVSYIHNRWVVPSHRVTIKHPDYTVGHYHDKDYIMLYAMFQLIVDYVEIECASPMGVSENYYETFWQKCNRWMRQLPILHWYLRPVRNARRGLHHLRWQMNMKDHPRQKQFAKDIFRVYRFWKHERPTRKDPFESYYKAREREGKDWQGKLTPHESKLLERGGRLENKQEKQDEQMLHLIIKHRNGLWT